jgi:hypothetical protein
MAGGVAYAPAHVGAQQQQQQQHQPQPGGNPMMATTAGAPPPVQSLNQTAEFFLSNYRLGKTLGIGSFGKVRCRGVDVRRGWGAVVQSGLICGDWQRCSGQQRN